MRTHTKSFHIRFTEDEYEKLCMCAEKAGLPKSTYIRFMIHGMQPKEAPPIEYFNMMKAFYAAGNNLNQIAHFAHRNGYLYEKELNKTLAQVDKLVLALTDTLIVPKKVDREKILKQGELISEGHGYTVNGKE